MITAKMKILLHLVVWILIAKNADSHGIGFGIKKEIFFLNLEDGYFGCQVNESTDFLQLYELSRLCDGRNDCYKGSDELARELKCSNDCTKESGARCENGACLDSQCHCNDGYGGCSCEVPDENECKYRPCDVFAHCTNTLGSFHCSCFPGYAGDGFHCQDINECEDPAVAARCVANSECCNLPAHFLCKCLPGFQGDGEEECRDIDECLNPHACGINAVCQNTPGNYTCSCLQGYEGNPFQECVDIDECAYQGSCGHGAICSNTIGGYQCACPIGTTGDPVHGSCEDIDECIQNPCGNGAICTNTPSSFHCACPPGFNGDPYIECADVDECSSSPCGKGALCSNKPGNYTCSCPQGYTGKPEKECLDINECGKTNACGVNAKCTNSPGSFTCSCPSGFTGDPQVFCQNINECERNPCGKNAICKDTVGSFACVCKEDYAGDPFVECKDIDECVELEKPCGSNAICENASPGYNCLCPQGYVANPEPSIACEQVDVNVLCKTKFDCVNNANCIDGQCFCEDGFKAVGSNCEDVNECAADPCGPFSVCTNTPGGFSCDCQSGYIGVPPRILCKAPCDDVKCGEHAYCKPDGQDAYCNCEEGWTFNPSDISAGCIDINECDKSHGPFGKCGKNAVCTNTPGAFSCQCKPGFTGNAFQECKDINECKDGNLCGKGAVCTNSPGSFSCTCPKGTAPEPDPFTKCVEVVTCSNDNECPGNAICDQHQRCFCPEPNVGNECRHPCESMSCGPNAECTITNGEAQCVCSSGFKGTPPGCVDIDECKERPCAVGAVCENNPGGYTCQCPRGSGAVDAYKGDCSSTRNVDSCGPTKPCPQGEICVSDAYLGGSVCICSSGFYRNEEGQCKDVDECEGEPCGQNAVCKNLPGSYECACPPGFNGNPFSGCEECNTLECKCRPPYKVVGKECILADCSKNNQCTGGAECVTIAGGVSYCACPKGMHPDNDGTCRDIDECKEPGTCGYGAQCVNKPGSFTCKCPKGYEGDPYRLCAPSQVRCINNADCHTNEICVQPGECVCPPPYFVDVMDSHRCKSPCERFACGINAKCTPSDPPKCQCATGFKPDPISGGCIDVNECEQNPCAEGALCINQNGRFQCVCPPGTKGDPFMSGCSGITGRKECSKDQDCISELACVNNKCVNPCDALPCGKNAHCVPEKHAAWCRCSTGFIESSEGCVSPCNGVVCGHDAQCIVTNNGPTCKCPEGAYGNPFPGGECFTDVCSPKKPCPQPSICVSGRCKNKCGNELCGVGAVCDSKKELCVCPPLFVGNPLLVCVPPIAMPACFPGCGNNAHCTYSISGNVCSCDPGTIGNPYEECSAQIEKQVCKPDSCGEKAICKQVANKLECSCPQGYRGNPYVLCEDIDECLGDACGLNSVCFNTPGSFDCHCKEGYVGNPFFQCIQMAPQACLDPATCACSKNVPCPDGYVCKKGKCKNQCDSVKCGPRAACVGGKCVCPPGFSGSPSDLKKGCTILEQCTNDMDCKSSEICFQQGKGLRKCVDACKKIQCGPNALCLSENHKSSCICVDGYFGSPNDLSIGCQPERAAPREDCTKNKDCPSGLICAVNVDGIHSCVDPCWNVACSKNEVCKTDKKGIPVCKCSDSYDWNPVTSECEKPSLPDCVIDSDCKSKESCRPDALGVLKCMKVCLDFTCPQNAVCVASSHKGYCQCVPGFTGNPNDRNGCIQILLNKCNSDSQCLENEKCVKGKNGAKSCQPACNMKKCGPNAFCVVNNHVAQCQCPPGPYTGDPNTTGCKEVPCIYNKDCEESQLCNRLTHTCQNVCDKYKCGDNAVCIGENHHAICQCPPGFKANPMPDIECTRINTCSPNPCHPTAVCEEDFNRYTCKCPPNKIGDPFTTGCHDEGDCLNRDSECPEQSVCKDNKCVNPCLDACGENAICTVVDRKPMCSCPPKFQSIGPSNLSPCVRIFTSCYSDGDCDGEVCINGQCKSVCRNSKDCSPGEKCVQNKCQTPCTGHGQCLNTQACVNGMCIMGCRSNKDCLENEACISNKCQDPCNKKACGTNALCAVKNHVSVCTCPKGFAGNPVPEKDCVRLPTFCSSRKPCPNRQMCVEGQCKPPCSGTHECAVGERCTDGVCLKVCFGGSNCLPGQVCIEGICKPGCTLDSDCDNFQICTKNRCRCKNGFVFGNTGCEDINECVSNPCHPTATCTNAIGSYKCTCENGKVGDPYGERGCKDTTSCKDDKQCSDSLSCINNACTDPCSSQNPCGQSALCSVTEHILECTCPAGHLGDPYDQLLGCFRVECTEDDDCPNDKFCDPKAYKCMNPCEKLNCGQGTCSSTDHKGLCSCYPGFVFINGKCVDQDECLNNPCHQSAICRNTIGSFLCSCANGMVSDGELGCRKPGDCIVHSDCPSSAACIDHVCRDPCLVPQTCAKEALCTTIDHSPVCSCPLKTTGDPKNKCTKLQCSSDYDCPLDKICVSGKCIDPCKLANVCGEKAMCSVVEHKAFCACSAGTTGDPHLGCVPLQYCSSELQCQSGTACHNGICLSVCTSSRECISDQLCISEVCQPTCHGNETCPDFQFCQNNICVKKLKCSSDRDCEDHQSCVINSVGQASCENVCAGKVCGRNAECSSKGHKAVCKCKPGYFGNPLSSCSRIECEFNEDCSSDKMCEEHMCKISCLVENPCGENAVCSAESHKQVCYCQPGFTGDPQIGCTPADYCAQKPCGPGATCVNSRGMAKCLCPMGTIGDPYKEGCTQSIECKTNQDCPDIAECVNMLGKTKCRDVCEDKICGQNAECKPLKHEAKCVCYSGYKGDPNDNQIGCRPKPVSCKTSADCPRNTHCYGNICRSSCQKHSECNLNEQCVLGRCSNPCLDPSSCGMNAKCDIVDHNKQCTCPAGFTGNSLLECVRIPSACSTERDCPENNACEDNICRPVCQADNDCALNEKCLNGSCKLTCRVDNDCFLGHICSNNLCIYGCSSDDDCSATESCRGNVCKNPCLETSCGPNAVCTVSNQRAVCSCENGLVPAPTAGIACVRAPPVPCSGNKQCASGHVCVEQKCRPFCASDSGCLRNEKCDGNLCVPVCRRDDDCRSGEICGNFMCLQGCRSDSGCPGDKACVNFKCVEPCESPTACGTNAKCTVKNHKKVCECLKGLVGDAEISCRPLVKSCQQNSDCSKGNSCYLNRCVAKCTSDSTCLSDERCLNGICKEICNTDAKCGPGQICENRVCEIGCRSDMVCSGEKACINKQCRDPCESASTCGSCAKCSVINHGVQCSCSNGLVGDPLVACIKPPIKCDGKCTCDESSGYCITRCKQKKDCACGNICSNGVCTAVCTNNQQCPPGKMCKNGMCESACLKQSDCPLDKTCTDGKCIDPCGVGRSPCGKNAECRVIEHRPLCLCPAGTAGEPTVACTKSALCTTDTECPNDKTCDQDGICRNPCLQNNPCGINAQCRAVDRKASCSCPPGFYGNAMTECKSADSGGDSCDGNPCGKNTVCKELPNGYECRCKAGCVGNPNRGCICEDSVRSDPCSSAKCGIQAACRAVGDSYKCYCPMDFPLGDPLVKCIKRGDCRTEGCGVGAECKPSGDNFVCKCPTGTRGNPQILCKPESECKADVDCPNEKACINGECIEVCNIRGSCGLNALCQPVFHRAVCSCPQCHTGDPTVSCTVDVNCKSSSPRIPSQKCKNNMDCPGSFSCIKEECQDPCTEIVCSQNKRCQVREHRPFCVCKFGFSLSETGELQCAIAEPQCKTSTDCSSDTACFSGMCSNPCHPGICSENRTCLVLNHKPVCVCTENCNPSVSICLRDTGCPPNLACTNFQCVNPCINTTCPQNAPCFVEDHKPVCKFCPKGFTADQKYGCVKDKELTIVSCTVDNQCTDKHICVEGKCTDPCTTMNKCGDNAECITQAHNVSCVCREYFYGDPYVKCIFNDTILFTTGQDTTIPFTTVFPDSEKSTSDYATLIDIRFGTTTPNDGEISTEETKYERTTLGTITTQMDSATTYNEHTISTIDFSTDINTYTLYTTTDKTPEIPTTLPTEASTSSITVFPSTSEPSKNESTTKTSRKISIKDATKEMDSVATTEFADSTTDSITYSSGSKTTVVITQATPSGTLFDETTSTTTEENIVGSSSTEHSDTSTLFSHPTSTDLTTPYVTSDEKITKTSTDTTKWDLASTTPEMVTESDKMLEDRTGTTEEEMGSVVSQTSADYTESVTAETTEIYTRPSPSGTTATATDITSSEESSTVSSLITESTSIGSSSTYDATDEMTIPTSMDTTLSEGTSAKPGTTTELKVMVTDRPFTSVQDRTTIDSQTTSDFIDITTMSIDITTKADVITSAAMPSETAGTTMPSETAGTKGTTADISSSEESSTIGQYGTSSSLLTESTRIDSGSTYETTDEMTVPTSIATTLSEATSRVPYTTIESRVRQTDRPSTTAHDRTTLDTQTTSGFSDITTMSSDVTTEASIITSEAMPSETAGTKGTTADISSSEESSTIGRYGTSSSLLTESTRIDSGSTSETTDEMTVPTSMATTLSEATSRVPYTTKESRVRQTDRPSTTAQDRTTLDTQTTSGFSDITTMSSDVTTESNVITSEAIPSETAGTKGTTADISSSEESSTIRQYGTSSSLLTESTRIDSGSSYETTDEMTVPTSMATTLSEATSRVPYTTIESLVRQTDRPSTTAQDRTTLDTQTTSGFSDITTMSSDVTTESNVITSEAIPSETAGTKGTTADITSSEESTTIGRYGTSSSLLTESTRFDSSSTYETTDEMTVPTSMATALSEATSKNPHTTTESGVRQTDRPFTTLQDRTTMDSQTTSGFSDITTMSSDVTTEANVITSEAMPSETAGTKGTTADITSSEESTTIGRYGTSSSLLTESTRFDSSSTYGTTDEMTVPISMATTLTEATSRKPDSTTESGGKQTGRPFTTLQDRTTTDSQTTSAFSDITTMSSDVKTEVNVITTAAMPSETAGTTADITSSEESTTIGRYGTSSSLLTESTRFDSSSTYGATDETTVPTSMATTLSEETSRKPDTTTESGVRQTDRPFTTLQDKTTTDSQTTSNGVMLTDNTFTTVQDRIGVDSQTATELPDLTTFRQDNTEATLIASDATRSGTKGTTADINSSEESSTIGQFGTSSLLVTEPTSVDSSSTYVSSYDMTSVGTTMSDTGSKKPEMTTDSGIMPTDKTFTTVQDATTVESHTVSSDITTAGRDATISFETSPSSGSTFSITSDSSEGFTSTVSDNTKQTVTTERFPNNYSEPTQTTLGVSVTTTLDNINYTNAMDSITTLSDDLPSRTNNIEDEDKITTEASSTDMTTRTNTKPTIRTPTSWFGSTQTSRYTTEPSITEGSTAAEITTHLGSTSIPTTSGPTTIGVDELTETTTDFTMSSGTPLTALTNSEGYQPSFSTTESTISGRVDTTSAPVVTITENPTTHETMMLGSTRTVTMVDQRLGTEQPSTDSTTLGPGNQPAITTVQDLSSKTGIYDKIDQSTYTTVGHKTSTESISTFDTMEIGITTLSSKKDFTTQPLVSTTFSPTVPLPTGSSISNMGIAGSTQPPSTTISFETTTGAVTTRSGSFVPTTMTQETSKDGSTFKTAQTTETFDGTTETFSMTGSVEKSTVSGTTSSEGSTSQTEITTNIDSSTNSSTESYKTTEGSLTSTLSPKSPAGELERTTTYDHKVTTIESITHSTTSDEFSYETSQSTGTVDVENSTFTESVKEPTYTTLANDQTDPFTETSEVTREIGETQSHMTPRL